MTSLVEKVLQPGQLECNSPLISIASKELSHLSKANVLGVADTQAIRNAQNSQSPTDHIKSDVGVNFILHFAGDYPLKPSNSNADAPTIDHFTSEKTLIYSIMSPQTRRGLASAI